MNERAIFLLILGGRLTSGWIRLLDHQGRVMFDINVYSDYWFNYPHIDERLAK